MARVADLTPQLLHGVSKPPARPLAIRGRSGSGKTRLLRSVLRQSGHEAVWSTAFDLVGQMADAIRSDRYSSYRQAFIHDGRPLCIEHVEDLRGKPMARGEVRRLLEDRASQGHPVLLTLTSQEGEADVVDWLGSWTELLRLD